VEIVIDKLSSGASPTLPETRSSIRLCHEAEGLLISHVAFGQKIVNPQSPYTECNSAIYNLDVAEAFLTSTSSLHCYSEIDIAPNNVMYEAGIFNPNLTHTNLQHSMYDCQSSGVKHDSSLDTTLGVWSNTISIPFELINCPAGCLSSSNPSATAQCTDRPSLIRGNFFRVVENVAASNDSCDSASCDYLAFSPTLVSPPSFHEPQYFAYFILE